MTISIRKEYLLAVLLLLPTTAICNDQSAKVHWKGTVPKHQTHAYLHNLDIQNFTKEKQMSWSPVLKINTFNKINLVTLKHI
ncbi:hypothetical protein HGP28_02735 [Vibrio sp. SM6]|uniref:Uncharacterized protein n=1 Tax=Vibrio agarilyticus TaxID=2726741 RepID=A0A7X8TNH1_9VIBR|nr:hypothetical protein [Vibrio agarilyticus]NLS11805.1 hypothetical protein [Vibrio agarilyticus]